MFWILNSNKNKQVHKNIDMIEIIFNINFSILMLNLYKTPPINDSNTKIYAAMLWLGNTFISIHPINPRKVINNIPKIVDKFVII